MAENGGRTCTVCTHAARDQINDLLAHGRPHRDVAGQFGLAKSSVQRHAASHLPAELAAAVAAERQAAAGGTLDRLDRYVATAEAILDNPKTKPQVKLAALRELLRGLNLRAKIEGEIESAKVVVTTSFHEQPEFRLFTAIIMRELAAHPEARARIVRALELEEEGSK